MKIKHNQPKVLDDKIRGVSDKNTGAQFDIALRDILSLCNYTDIKNC